MTSPLHHLPDRHGVHPVDIEIRLTGSRASLAGVVRHRAERRRIVAAIESLESISRVEDGIRGPRPMHAAGPEALSRPQLLALAAAAGSTVLAAGAVFGVVLTTIWSG